MYKVVWERKAIKNLSKLDQEIAKKIKFNVETVLIKDPYKEGKPLKGDLKGRRKFRFSKYRIIYKIRQEKLLILVVEVGHRREIYY